MISFLLGSGVGVIFVFLYVYYFELNDGRTLTLRRFKKGEKK